MLTSSAISQAIHRLERNHPIWVCLLPALVLVPWLDKAFHIDDPQFLIHARLIAEHPFDPFVQSFEWDFMQVALIDFPHPLLWQYLLAGVTQLFGESERAMHLLVLGFACIGLAGLRGLAIRLGVSPLAACALMAGSSAFVVMGSTIMPDLVAASLAVAAIERCVAACEEENAVTAWMAGLLAAGAFLTRFTALFAVGLLLLYPLFRRSARARAYLPFAVAVGVVVSYELVSVAIAGRPHFISSVFRWTSDSSLYRDLHFAFNELVFLGAQFPVTGLVLLAGCLGGIRSVMSTVALGGVAILIASYSSLPGGGAGIALLFAWPGLVMVFDSLRRVFEGFSLRFEATDPATALRWMLSLMLIATTFATFRYEHVAMKYLLLPLPAAILLLLDRLSITPIRWRLAVSIALWVSCAVGGVTGSAVGWSDYRWANTYRDFFEADFRDHLEKRESSSGRVYYNAQWGLRYYAERAGLLPFRGGALGPDDELVMSVSVPPNWEVQGIPDVVVARYEIGYDGPFALLSSRRQAGFYSNFWGDWPFVPAAQVDDVIFVLRDASSSD